MRAAGSSVRMRRMIVRAVTALPPSNYTAIVNHVDRSGQAAWPEWLLGSAVLATMA